MSEHLNGIQQMYQPEGNGLWYIFNLTCTNVKNIKQMMLIY